MKTIPVCVLTTSNGEHEIAEAYRNGANCYVTKPVDVDQFVAQIRAITDFWFNVAEVPRWE